MEAGRRAGTPLAVEIVRGRLHRTHRGAARVPRTDARRTRHDDRARLGPRAAVRALRSSPDRAGGHEPDDQCDPPRASEGRVASRSRLEAGPGGARFVAVSVEDDGLRHPARRSGAAVRALRPREARRGVGGSASVSRSVAGSSSRMVVGSPCAMRRAAAPVSASRCRRRPPREEGAAPSDAVVRPRPALPTRSARPAAGARRRRCRRHPALSGERARSARIRGRYLRRRASGRFRSSRAVPIPDVVLLDVMMPGADGSRDARGDPRALARRSRS